MGFLWQRSRQNERQHVLSRVTGRESVTEVSHKYSSGAICPQVPIFLLSPLAPLPYKLLSVPAVPCSLQHAEDKLALMAKYVPFSAPVCEPRRARSAFGAQM